MPVTKESIAGSNHRLSREINVPEFGGKIRVCMMTVGEREAWERGDLVSEEKDGKTVFVPNLASVRARLLVRCLADEDGQRLFTDSPEDLAILDSVGCAPIEQLYMIATRLNKVRNKDIEEMRKNSETILGSDST